MDDARQEILLGLCVDLRRFRFQARFKTFFYRYARNKAIDYLRRNARIRHREMETAVTLPEKADSPEEALLKREAIKELQEGLRTLSPEDRSLVLMKETEGFSIEDLCRITGMKSGTVKSRLHRAREKLYRTLKGGDV